MDKRLLIVILVLIVSAISFGRSFLGLIGAIPWQYGYSDVFNADRIDAASARQIPYVEMPIEYPVITGFFIYFMWILGKNLLGYAVLTWIFLALLSVITALTLYKLAEMLKLGNSRLFWFFIFAPSMIVFGIYNWDIIAVMFMVLGVYSFYKNRPMAVGAFICLGFNAKLFPVILLPIMMLKTTKRNAAKMLLTFVLAFLVLNSYFMLSSFDTWKNTFLFHGLREPNIDSAWHITGLSTGTINIASAGLFAVSYIALLMFLRKRDFITLSFIAILLFLLFNKIFSPQYILWLLPFFVLLNIGRKIFYLLETMNLLVFFSTLYWLLASKEQIFLTALGIFTIIRSTVMVYIAYTILKIKTFKYNYQP